MKKINNNWILFASVVCRVLPQLPFVISKSLSRPADPSPLELSRVLQELRSPPLEIFPWSPRNREGLRRGRVAGWREIEDYGAAEDREDTDGDRDP